MKRLGVGGVVVVVTAVAVAVMVVVSLAQSRTPRLQGRGEAPWPSPAVSAPATAAPAGFLAGEGSSLVPEELAPGRYRSLGPSGSAACMAFAENEAGGKLDMDVSRGPTLLVVPAGARSAKAQGCMPFEKVR